MRTDQHNNDDDSSDNFVQVLDDLIESSKKKKNNPRSLRLGAVAAAMKELLVNNNQEEEDDAVLAATVYTNILAAMEGSLVKQQEEQDEISCTTLVAFLDLMQYVLPYVSIPTLWTTMGWMVRLCKATVKIMATLEGMEHSGSPTKKQKQQKQQNKNTIGPNATLRAVCDVSMDLLQKLNTSSSSSLSKRQEEQQVQNLLQYTLLHLCRDVKPKVRKHAQECVVVLLQQQPQQDDVVVVTRVVQQTVSNYTNAVLLLDDDETNQNDNNAKVLHDLQFLNQIVPYLDVNAFGTAVTKLLLLQQQQQENDNNNNSMFVDVTATTKKKQNEYRTHLCTHLLQVLYTCVSHSDCTNYDAVLASLLQSNNNVMMKDSSSAEATILYSKILLTSCTRLLQSQQQEQEQIGYKLFPVALSRILILLKNYSHDDMAVVAQDVMVELTFLLRSTALGNAEKRTDSLQEERLKCLETCITNMHGPILLHSYRSTWSVTLTPLVIMVLQHYSLLDDASSSSQCQHVTTSFVDLRTSLLSNSSSSMHVDDGLKMLIQGIGLTTAWPWLDWKPNNKKKDWILVLLRECHFEQPQPLAFFQETILPLARRCDVLSSQQKSKQHYYKARVVDLWMLLPVICQGPSPPDLATCMPSLSQTFIKALGDHNRYPQLITTICGGLKMLVSGVLDRQDTIEGGEESNHEQDLAVMQQVSVKTLPALFKLVETLHGTSTKATNDDDAMETSTTADKNQSFLVSQRAQSVTQAIAALARLAPKEFLQKLFSKIMQRLLLATQSNQDEKICTLLGLAQALVVSESLHHDSVALLYRTLKPLCRSDEWEARVQKRAYKCMAEVCVHYPSFVTSEDHLDGMIELLTGSIMTCQISARHMRLKCITCIVENLNYSNPKHKTLISKIVGEVLLCLKDSNGKTREAAYQLLISMAALYDDDIVEYFKIILAALGAETPHMRSAAVMASSRLVFEYARNDMRVQALVPSLLQTILVLFDENCREVLKSVIGFVRVSVAAMTPQQLEPLLPELMTGMLKYGRGKDRFRAKIKIILKKLVRTFGYDKLLPLVPDDNARLLTHMRKLDERAKRRKETGGVGGDVAYDDMMESDEEDSDDGRTLMTGATGFTAMTGRTGRSLRGAAATRGGTIVGDKSAATSTKRSRASVSKKLPQAQLRVETEDGDVMDMLDPKMAKSVHFAEQDADSDDDDDSLGVMEFDDEGRLVVPDDDDDSKDNNAMGDYDDEDQEENAEIKFGGKKRRLSKYESAKAARDEKKKTKQEPKALGAAYKSKKAGGDVKRKDQKYEPYAYVPLDGKSYTKKNRRAAVEQMSTVVRHGKRKRR